MGRRGSVIKYIQLVLLFIFLSSVAFADTPPLKSDPFGSPGGSTSYNYLLGLINSISQTVSAEINAQTLVINNFIASFSGSQGVTSRGWNSYIAIGDLNNYGSQNMDSTKTFPNIIGNALGIAPQYEATNSFTDWQADIVNSQIIPGFNPQTQNNPLITFFPSVTDPGYNQPPLDTSHEAIVDSVRQAAIIWLTVPQKYKIYAQAFSQTGSWINTAAYGGKFGITSSTLGDTAVGTITTYGNPIYLIYQLNGSNSGTFTWQVDTGPVSSNIPTQGPGDNFSFPVTSGVFSVALIRIPGISAGLHAVNIVNTSSGGSITPIAIATAPAGVYDGGNPTLFIAGQLRQVNDTQSAATLAYNNDIKNDVATLAADSLNIKFVDVRNSICCNTTTDIVNNIQLSALGQKHLADVFGGAIQAQPNETNSVNPKKYGSVCNARLFTNTFIGSQFAHQITTTMGSNKITISNYTVQPGAASCSGGGGDGGQVITLFNNAFPLYNEGPTTYISAVTTSDNSLTLAPGWAAAGSSSTVYAIMDGCPSNPNDWSTAHDDSAGFNAASNAIIGFTPLIANAFQFSTPGGGIVRVPPNCAVHEVTPANNTMFEGSMAGSNYGGGNAPGETATPVYFMSNTLAFDPPYAFDISGTFGVGFKDLQLSSVAFASPGGGSGMLGSCIGGNSAGSLGELGTEEVLLDHVQISDCPVGFGPYLGSNMPVSFTASVPNGSNQMTVSAITSNNMGTSYTNNVGGGISTDQLALKRTITGNIGIAGATLLTGPMTGGAGTYTLSLNSTTTITAASLTSPLQPNVWSGTFINDKFTFNGVGANGAFSDSVWLFDTFTGNFLDGLHNGPNTTNSGCVANNYIGGRGEENGRDLVFDTGCAAQIHGRESQYNSDSAITLIGGNNDVQLDGFWFDANSGGSSSGNRAQIRITSNNNTLSVIGGSGASENFATHFGIFTQYFIQTLTGTTGNKVTVESGNEISQTYNTSFANWLGGSKPSYLKINVPSLANIDTTVVPTITGLAAVTTSQVGGINSGTILSGVTSSAGVLNLTSLPSDNVTTWNCQAGDETAGTLCALSASTSSSCALNCSTTSGDTMWYSGQPH